MLSKEISPLMIVDVTRMLLCYCSLCFGRTKIAAAAAAGCRANNSEEKTKFKEHTERELSMSTVSEGRNKKNFTYNSSQCEEKKKKKLFVP